MQNANHTTNFDPFNPYSFAAEREARSQTFERHQQLPHPLTFRLVNPNNGNIVYAGIREFSADENEIGLSPFLRQTLGLEPGSVSGISDDNGDSNKFGEVTVHAHQLAKGTYVRLRPLEAGYDPEDWKSLLERYLRDNFTTLTTGEVLTVPAGKEQFRFLIDKIAPEGDGICIIDTDLEVDIEALNEEQARETLKRRTEKSIKAPGSTQGSSLGGELSINEEVSGQVLPGEYVDYGLGNWDRTTGLDVFLESADTDGNVDLFVSPTGPRQRARPREDEFIFADLSVRPSKRVRVQNSNVELDGAEGVWISVHGYAAANKDPDSDAITSNIPLSYHLKIRSNDSHSNGESDNAGEAAPGTDETKCKNCQQWIPSRAMMLHENFCFRNNILCPHCHQVFKKSSPEWQNHWHCSHDISHGNTIGSCEKHNALYHISQKCSYCGYEASDIPSLAHHRTSTCPGKQILCKFCHLLVPQQGPDDPDPLDAEVILSGLTPHELADGARTTECHMCGKIIRLRDMETHLKHHDLERRSRSIPRLCRNVNCGRTIDGTGPNGEIKRPQPARNDLGVCDTCYGPLYNSTWDPEGKALKRRVERKYLTQLLTGCGRDWCRNEYCKTGRKYLDLGEQAITSKEALSIAKPILNTMKNQESPLHFCTDEASQKRRVLAGMIAAEDGDREANSEAHSGYDLPWCIAALEAETGDLDRARTWLHNWAPTTNETRR